MLQLNHRTEVTSVVLFFIELSWPVLVGAGLQDLDDRGVIIVVPVGCYIFPGYDYSPLSGAISR